MINVILACASMSVAGAASGEAAPVAGPQHTVAAAVVGAADRDVAPSRARACVEAYSKNICDSVLTTYGAEGDGCPFTICKTVFVPEAYWKMSVRSNYQGCRTCNGGNGTCDETPYLNGDIESWIEYTFRANDPCPFRGCFEGRWRQQTDNGVYSGYVTGTFGVGTHRFNNHCPEASGDRSCERCLDVEFIPHDDGHTGTWRIAVEAVFQGWRESGEPIPDKVHFSLSGDLYAEGDVSGPRFDGDWKFAGTADGVHIDYCN